jgi:hypothetical protein
MDMSSMERKVTSVRHASRVKSFMPLSLGFVGSAMGEIRVWGGDSRCFSVEAMVEVG